MKFSLKIQKLILERDKLDSLELVENQKLTKAIETLSQTNGRELSELNVRLSELLAQEKTFFGLLSWDTAITLGITILVFFLGYLGNHLYNKYLASQEAGSVREHFSEWVDLHSDPINKQIENLNDISERLRNSQELQEEQLAINSFQLEKLLELSNLRLLNIFVTNSKGDKKQNLKAYFNLINSLEYLASNKERLFEKYVEFTKGTDDIRNEWNSNFREFDELRVSLIRGQMVSQSREGDFARRILEFSSRFFTDRTPEGAVQPIITLEEWANDFFAPLRTLTIEEMSQNPSFLDVQILASKIEDLLIVYKRWVAWKDGFSSVFDDFKTRLKESYENVEKQIGHFKINDSVGCFKFQLFR